MTATRLSREREVRNDQTPTVSFGVLFLTAVLVSICVDDVHPIGKKAVTLW